MARCERNPPAPDFLLHPILSTSCRYAPRSGQLTPSQTAMQSSALPPTTLGLHIIWLDVKQSCSHAISTVHRIRTHHSTDTVAIATRSYSCDSTVPPYFSVGESRRQGLTRTTQGASIGTDSSHKSRWPEDRELSIRPSYVRKRGSTE